MLDFGWQEEEPAQDNAADARRSAAQLADQVRALTRRVDEQAAVLHAVARMLADKLGLTDGEVMEFVRQAQAARASGTTRVCAACGNKLPPRKAKCIYCGAEQPPESVGDAV